MYFSLFLFFFFNDTATTEIYTLSLHDALPICPEPSRRISLAILIKLTATVFRAPLNSTAASREACADRKSTRLNSSHLVISYAVFCLKKKKNQNLFASLYAVIDDRVVDRYSVP